MWEQEQRIMFCDVSSLDPDKKAYMLAMHAQILAQKMVVFSGGFNSSSGGNEGGVNGTTQ